MANSIVSVTCSHQDAGLLGLRLSRVPVLRHEIWGAWDQLQQKLPMHSKSRKKAEKQTIFFGAGGTCIYFVGLLGRDPNGHPPTKKIKLLAAGNQDSEWYASWRQFWHGNAAAVSPEPVVESSARSLEKLLEACDEITKSKVATSLYEETCCKPQEPNIRSWMFWR